MTVKTVADDLSKKDAQRLALGSLAIKQHELFERAKNGSLPAEFAEACLQRMFGMENEIMRVLQISRDFGVLKFTLAKIQGGYNPEPVMHQIQSHLNCSKDILLLTAMFFGTIFKKSFHIVPGTPTVAYEVQIDELYLVRLLNGQNKFLGNESALCLIDGKVYYAQSANKEGSVWVTESDRRLVCNDPNFTSDIFHEFCIFLSKIFNSNIVEIQNQTGPAQNRIVAVFD